VQGSAPPTPPPEQIQLNVWKAVWAFLSHRVGAALPGVAAEGGVAAPSHFEGENSRQIAPTSGADPAHSHDRPCLKLTKLVRASDTAVPAPRHPPVFPRGGIWKEIFQEGEKSGQQAQNGGANQPTSHGRLGRVHAERIRLLEQLLHAPCRPAAPPSPL
jgi:hypothetical protein